MLLANKLFTSQPSVSGEMYGGTPRSVMYAPSASSAVAAQGGGTFYVDFQGDPTVYPPSVFLEYAKGNDFNRASDGSIFHSQKPEGIRPPVVTNDTNFMYLAGNEDKRGSGRHVIACFDITDKSVPFPLNAVAEYKYAPKDTYHFFYPVAVSDDDTRLLCLGNAPGQHTALFVFDVTDKTKVPAFLWKAEFTTAGMSLRLEHQTRSKRPFCHDPKKKRLVSWSFGAGGGFLIADNLDLMAPDNTGAVLNGFRADANGGQSTMDYDPEWELLFSCKFVAFTPNMGLHCYDLSTGAIPPPQRNYATDATLRPTKIDRAFNSIGVDALNKIVIIIAGPNFVLYDYSNYQNDPTDIREVGTIAANAVTATGRNIGLKSNEGVLNMFPDYKVMLCAGGGTSTTRANSVVGLLDYSDLSNLQYYSPNESLRYNEFVESMLFFRG